MINKLIQHENLVDSELGRISKLKSKDTRTKELTRLLDYQDQQIKNFQHERLIHLIVTLFFAGLTLMAWISSFLWQALLAYLNIKLDSSINYVNSCLIILSILLTILLVNYVRHYYKLENGIQRLYYLYETIYQKLSPKKH